MGWGRLLEMKPTNKTCKYHKCRKKIRKEDKSVALLTFENNNMKESVYFHFQCYLDWFNESVNAHADEKIQKAAPIALKKALSQAPMMADQIMKGLFNSNDSEKEGDKAC